MKCTYNNLLCGNEEKVKNLKRKIAGVCLALFTVASLTACGSEGTGAVSADKQLKDMEVEKYVTVGDYQNLTIDIDAKHEATEEEIEYYVNMYLQYYGNGVDGSQYTKEGAIQVGDTVNLDFAGVMEEVESDGLSGESYDLTIGSGSFIDGFEDGLIGHEAGDVVELELMFPENYWNTEMAGLPVVFTVTINYIVSEEYNDAKAAAIGIDGVNSVAELSSYIETMMAKENESNYNSSIVNAITNAMVASSIYEELPKNLISRYETFIETNIASQAAYSGMTSEEYVSQNYGMELSELTAQYGAETLRQYLAAQAIANKENIVVTDEELDENLLKNATEAGFDNVEEYMGDFTREDFRDSMMYDRVIDFIKNNTNLVINETIAD